MSTKQPAPSDIADKFMLRLPEGMREHIRYLAEKNKRSMNAEIVARLDESINGPHRDQKVAVIEDGKPTSFIRQETLFKLFLIAEERALERAARGEDSSIFAGIPTDEKPEAPATSAADDE